jgi:t-SNARE complex subunit (syntaxin)
MDDVIQTRRANKIGIEKSSVYIYNNAECDKILNLLIIIIIIIIIIITVLTKPMACYN